MGTGDPTPGSGPRRGEGTGAPHTLVDRRYELQRELGRGGMGVVWEARDTRLNRQVAIKELLFRNAMDPETQAQWVQRARREAQAIARIGHEHVVSVHDVIESDGQVWIVMEQVNPRSLADLLRDHERLPVGDTARIGLQVLRGLRAVHAAGVLHRDVKPHNVLFRKDARAVLMDFGIATFEGAAQVTRRHETVGTPQYLPPELATPWGGQQRSATPASDLWSFGVTLYETVEGRAPFRGPTPFEVLEAVRESALPEMQYAGPLRPLIEGLLVKDPEQRMTAARAEELLQHIAQETPSHGGLSHQGPYGPGRAGGQGADGPDGPHGPAGGAGEQGNATRLVGRFSRLRPPRSGGVDGDGADRRRRTRRSALVGGVALAVLLGVGWYAMDGWDSEDTPSLQDSATYREARKRGYLAIGVKSDQPGLSEVVNEEKETYRGFDIEIAKAVAEYLGFEKIQFQTVNTASREYRLRKGDVDLIVASYSITPERKEQVDFAGPYNYAGQDFLVRKDAEEIDGREDLDGKKVCTVDKSTPVAGLKEYVPKAIRTMRSSYGKCVQDLLAGTVDAVSTDDIILAGYRSQYDKELKILDDQFSTEEYGIGIAKGDEALKSAVCDALAQVIADGDWTRLYREHLEPLFPERVIPRTPTLKECDEGQ